MGMTIDKTIEFFDGLECHTPQAKDAKDVAIDTMRKYQMFQAKYVERLKEDMVAMLTEIQLEIEELYPKARKTYRDGLTSYCEGVDDSREIIQQKIDALKGD